MDLLGLYASPVCVNLLSWDLTATAPHKNGGFYTFNIVSRVTRTLHASHAREGDTSYVSDFPAKYTDLLLVTANRLGKKATRRSYVVARILTLVLDVWATREFWIFIKILSGDCSKTDRRYLDHLLTCVWTNLLMQHGSLLTNLALGRKGAEERVRHQLWQ